MKTLHSMELDVPVTNPLPYSDVLLHKVVRQFKKEGLVFGLAPKQIGNETRYTIWREAMPDETFHNSRKAAYFAIRQSVRPDIQKFSFVWVGFEPIKGIGAANYGAGKHPEK